MSNQQQWQQAGYDYSTAKKWIELGIKPQELELVNWIKAVKGLRAADIGRDGVNPLRSERKRRNVPPNSAILWFD